MFATLTRPQFALALKLARAHAHGWAEQLDKLGVDPSSRDEGYVPGGGRAWQRTRGEKVDRSTVPEREALRRLEAEWLTHAEVAVADLEAVSLMGSADWEPALRDGIWAPRLDALGATSHITKTGRLGWTIFRDGRAVLEVHRPGGPLFAVSAVVAQADPKRAEWASFLLEAASPKAERERPRTHQEALELRERIALALTDGGCYTLPAEFVGPNTGAEVALALVASGQDSLCVLRAEVSALGGLRVDQLAQATLHLRHVQAMARALEALGLEWEPGLALQDSV